MESTDDEDYLPRERTFYIDEGFYFLTLKIFFFLI